MKLPSIKTTLTATTVLVAAGALAFAGTAYSQQKGDAAALQSAKVSLVEAIEIAQAETGGTAVEAEFEIERGKASYELELIGADGSEVEVRIDSQTGEIVSTEVEQDADDEDDAKIMLAALSDLSMSLEDAIARAEADSGGQAIEAELELEDGQALFEVELLRADGSEVELTFDATAN